MKPDADTSTLAGIVQAPPQLGPPFGRQQGVTGPRRGGAGFPFDPAAWSSRSPGGGRPERLSAQRGGRRLPPRPSHDFGSLPPSGRRVRRASGNGHQSVPFIGTPDQLTPATGPSERGRGRRGEVAGLRRPGRAMEMKVASADTEAAVARRSRRKIRWARANLGPSPGDPVATRMPTCPPARPRSSPRHP